MTQQLQNQRIIIAGGTSGIGLALVRLLVNERPSITAGRPSVIAIGRDPGKLAALKNEFPAAEGVGSIEGAGSVEGVALDARDRPALDDFFREQPPIDHLVLALSGGKGGGAFKDLLLHDLKEGFDQKFWPQLQVLQAALPYMSPAGSITFITAISATAQLPGTAGLAAINGALELMVPILAKELQPLRINAVSPGMIDTPWWDFLPAGTKKEVFADFSSKVSVGRIGKPEEVAAAVRCIITNDYINGIVLGCHGGLN